MNKASFSVLGFALAGVLAFMLPVRLQAQAPQYSVTLLGPLVNGTDSSGYAINASGQVVGFSIAFSINATNYAHAVRWTGTTPTDLGTLGGRISIANGINASGQVAGDASFSGDTVDHAVRWTGTTPTDLGTLGGTNSAAQSINTSGQVAGNSSLAGDSVYHAVRWTGTTPTDLGSLGGNSAAFGINNSGEVAGYSYNAGNSVQSALVWNGTTPTAPSGLGGTNSEAQGINTSGQVAGYCQTTGNAAWHAVVWNGTTPTDLGTLGGIDSYAEGINDSGQVLGVSETTGPQSEAFLYTGGTMYDLNNLILPGSGVTDLYLYNGTSGINNLGQITAYGTVNGVEQAVLLTPTPEPTTAILILGSGVMWIASRRRPTTI